MFINGQLKKGFKNTERAKNAPDEEADKLFTSAYKIYSKAVQSYPAVQKGLYWWGLALFDQAKRKSGLEAKNLFQESVEKFCAALVVDPTNSRVANDWGVALMEQARAKSAGADDPLYNQAKDRFELAGRLQPGIASYNLACISSLCGEHEECKTHLDAARSFGTLPDSDDLENDSDLSNVKQLDWFQAFIENPSEAIVSQDTSSETDASETT